LPECGCAGWVDGWMRFTCSGWARVDGWERELLYAGVGCWAGRRDKRCNGGIEEREQGSKGTREQREGKGRWGPGVRRFRLGPVVGWRREAVPAQPQRSPSSLFDYFRQRQALPRRACHAHSQSSIPSLRGCRAHCRRHPHLMPSIPSIATSSGCRCQCQHRQPNSNPNPNPKVVMYRLASWLADG
jgi:hypothetical protein